MAREHLGIGPQGVEHALGVDRGPEHRGILPHRGAASDGVLDGIVRRVARALHGEQHEVRQPLREHRPRRAVAHAALAQLIQNVLHEVCRDPPLARPTGDDEGLRRRPDVCPDRAPQQLDGRLVDAHEVLSPEALAMFGEVAQAPDDERRMAVFEDYLAAHAAGFEASLWQAAVRSGTRLSVRLLSRLLQVGDRQTIRATRKALGVGVSDLRRFARGEAAFGELSARLKDSDKAVSLADIAAEAGYADQSHLSRECKAVTGRTPREFLRGFEGDEADWIYRATRALVDRPDR